MKTEEKYEVIAISLTDFERFGCPYCGFRSPASSMSVGDTAVCECGKNECGKTFCVLADGVARSSIVVRDSIPELRSHPFRAAKDANVAI